MKSFSIQEINSVLQGTIVGNTTSTITGPEQLEMASNSQISFIELHTAYSLTKHQININYYSVFAKYHGICNKNE